MADRRKAALAVLAATCALACASVPAHAEEAPSTHAETAAATTVTVSRAPGTSAEDEPARESDSLHEGQETEAHNGYSAPLDKTGDRTRVLCAAALATLAAAASAASRAEALAHRRKDSR